MNIIDHGKWLPYTPVLLPDGAPPNALFARRESDGVDWYVYRKTGFQRDSVKCAAIWRSPVAGYVIGPAVRDVTMIFPPDHIVFEITDYVGDNPQEEFRNKIYDPVRHSFAERKRAPAGPTMQELLQRIEALEAKINNRKDYR